MCHSENCMDVCGTDCMDGVSFSLFPCKHFDRINLFGKKDLQIFHLSKNMGY